MIVMGIVTVNNQIITDKVPRSTGIYFTTLTFQILAQIGIVVQGGNCL